MYCSKLNCASFDREAVRSNAEIGSVTLFSSAFPNVSHYETFLLATACSIEKISLWSGLLHITSGSETNEKICMGMEPGPCGYEVQYAIY